MSPSQGGGSITSVLHETRVFPPPEEFARKAHIASLDQYEACGIERRTTPRGSGPSRRRLLHWDKPWDKVLDWQPPFAQVVRRRQAQRVL